MSLYTKSILREREKSDGIRISVMSRHTLEDGKRIDTRITNQSYDEHLALLAPSLTLIGDYYRGLPWDEFETKYLEQIRRGQRAVAVLGLVDRALRRDLTLLCIEKSPEKCHRRLLAQECLRLNPALIVAIA